MRDILDKAPTSAPPLHRQTWRHSPVPYLFGGLAAMFCIIAFAIVLIVCSFLEGENSSSSNNNSNGSSRDVEMIKGESSLNSPPSFGEGFVVVMPGVHRPTYLATPVSGKADDFCGGGGNVTVEENEKVAVGSTVIVPGGD